MIICFSERIIFFFFFFFQAEDGIRDYKVTGVQTCALPISVARRRDQQRTGRRGEVYEYCVVQAVGGVGIVAIDGASATRVVELANRRAARSVSPAAAPSMLVVIVVPFMFAASPLPLFRPLASPLLMPARGPTVFPLAPVSRRDVVIPHRYEQDGPGHELRSDDDPRAVVSRAQVPAAVRKGPVLTIVEEEIGGLGRHGRHG